MKTNAGITGTRRRKDQAITIESIKGYSNDDYIESLEKLPMLKISGARVCMFLANEKIVEHLTNKKSANE